MYDIVEADGQTFLSMEFIDGEDLASLLRRIGRLPPDKAVEIARQLCLGVAAAHEQGVIHRDLKPANVMLDGRGRARVMDFGLARIASELAEQKGQAGTPAYMSPEQLAGKDATIQSDIYAIGLILYEIFTGKRPFPGTSLAERVKQKEKSAPTPSGHVSQLDPAIERVILRCLEWDPANRPSSALAVAAALPGGDPLAAALAAGEMPSPEMVAAAGDPDTWSPSRTALVLMSILLALVACVLLYPHGMLLGRISSIDPPEVLTQRSRTLLRKLGYERGKDSAVGFDHDSRYLRWLRDEPASRTWDRLASSRQPALYFWYRQSPDDYLAPDLYYPYQGTLEPGRITLTEPAPLTPGMVSVKLDLQGRLRELQAVPPSKDPAPPQEGVDWKWLFDAAGLEMNRFTKAVPVHVPTYFATDREAWTGVDPEDPAIPLRVEAASFHGQAVSFRIIGPWTDQDDKQTGSQGTLDQAGLVFYAVFFVAVLGSAVVLAPRNWRQGRSDRKGAFRLAFATFLLLMVVWVIETHHVPSLDELRLLILGGAYALSWAGLLWLTYIALEPYVRQLWPETLISWTRLLAGNWQDARVGRDILIGVLVGLVAQILDLLGRSLPGWVGMGRSVSFWDWWIPNSFLPGYWLGNFLLNVVYSFRWAFFHKLLLLLVLRSVLKKPWAAGAVYVVVAAALWTATTADLQPSWHWTVALLVEFVFLCVIVRVGILALITSIFVWYCVCFPMSPDLTLWYAQSTLMAVGSVLALAGYGLFASRSHKRDAVSA